MPNIIGVGPDNVFGNANDIDVDLGADIYAPDELFTGVEETLQTVAFGLSTGTGIGPFFDVETGLLRYTGDNNGADVVTIGAINSSDTLNIVIDDGTPRDFTGVVTITAELRGGDDALMINRLANAIGLTQVMVNMGHGDDRVAVQPAPQTTVTINGGAQSSGDLLVVDAQGETISETVDAITAADAQPIQHQNIERVDVINAPVALPLTLRAEPTLVAPGAPLTYTLIFTNSSELVAHDATITMTIPTSVIDLGLINASPSLSQSEDALLTWHLPDLPTGQGGFIQLAGRIDPAITSEQIITNVATIDLARQMLSSPPASTATVSVVVTDTIDTQILLPIIQR